MPNPFQDPLFIAPIDEKPVLVEINARMIPLVLYALDKFKYRRSWVSDADYMLGLRQINALEVSLLTSTQDITIAIDRVYRLIDASVNGAVYTATGIDAESVLPAIPLAPDTTLGPGPSLRGQQLAAQGTLPAGWFELGTRPVTWADLLNAMRQGSEAEGESLLDKLDLLGDATDIASLFGVVRSTVTDGLELGAEGGILAVLVASTMANAAMAGLQGQQLDTLNAKLDRIITAMDGGGELAPATNVLGELASIDEKLT